MKREKGLTLVEALVVLAVIAIVAGLLTPVFLKVKQNARVATSVGHVKQLLGALMLYRQDYDGVDVFDGPQAYYRVGLPAAKTEFWPSEQLRPYGATDEVWRPPCGFDAVIFDTAPCWGELNRVCYTAAFYDPINMLPGSGNLSDLGDYLKTYRENSVVFVDPFCNPPGTKMWNPLITKRGIGGLLSGQVVNRYKKGRMGTLDLRWFSDPPR
jgi:prepilin-type N-terminal cleavage/methylation domain-containing protein